MIKTKWNIVFSLFFISSIFGRFSLKAQDSLAIDIKEIAAVIVLDSFVVTAEKRGFSVEDFIRYVLEDKSFYQAFQNIRTSNYSADNEIVFYKANGKRKADYKSITKQVYKKSCRRMETSNETVNGRFYKRKKKYNYYTAKMFDRVFFTHGEVCSTKAPTVKGKKKGMEKNIAQLKKLIFQPGHRIDVPFIGNRTAIFESHMIPKYDYLISSGMINEVDCYIFSVRTKSAIEYRSPHQTIIKQMDTYFEKETFQVLGRKYHLLYDGLAFSFDVKMDIKLIQKEGVYLPSSVFYTGNWSVPFQKKERGMFKAEFIY